MAEDHKTTVSKGNRITMQNKHKEREILDKRTEFGEYDVSPQYGYNMTIRDFRGLIRKRLLIGCCI